MQISINAIIACIIIGQMLCNAHPATTDNISKTTTELDCSQFTNDLEILATWPFRTYINPLVTDRTHVLMTSTDHKIYTLQILRESYIPSTVFCLKNLATLIIDGTPFHCGNEECGTDVMLHGFIRLKLLTTLVIQNTPINKMPDLLGNLTTLVSLTLSNCSLFSLPNLSTLTQLSKLSTPFNPLTALIGLQRVSTLDVRNCHLSNIPAMAVPTALSILDMRNNRLSQVVNLYLYRSLRDVSFYGNRISQLLPSIAQLTILQFLDLSNNELWALPSDILNLPALKALNIANNTFSSAELHLIRNNFRAYRPTVSLVS